MQTEFGGYLPLELPLKNEYFEAYGDDVIRLDCGRHALLAAVRDAGAKKVFLPVYTCETVYEAVRQTGAEIVPYRIDESWQPVDVEPEEGAWLVYTNYFGAITPALVEKIRTVHPRIIFDNTQAFFAPPIMGRDTYNIYSCRKFFGVADGAYLLARGIGRHGLEFAPTTSWQYSTQLLKCYEAGTNGAYAESKANEAHFDAEVPKAMSALTRRILQSIDYKEVRARRHANFVTLHGLLGETNPLQFWQESDTPYIYPFYCEKPGLRAALVESKIYAPQLWSEALAKAEPGSMEERLSQYMIPLPIDQRYGMQDMTRLARLVRDLAAED